MIADLLLLHAAVTWALLGLIWTIQLVHYPLFARVGSEQFISYEREHQSRITWIVAPLMALELTAAVLLVLLETGIPFWMSWLGLALVGVNWLATALLAVPQHHILQNGFNRGAHRRLLYGNWIRTAAWTLRGVLALALIRHPGG